MSLQRKIKQIVENLTGTRIYRTLPDGVDFIKDISHYFPLYNINTIFDVGANIGQSSEVYLSRLPLARIHCFEPVASTFEQLKNNLNHDTRIDFHQCALGSSASDGAMALQGSSDMFFLLGQSTEPVIEGGTKEPVQVLTLDKFCASKNITKIDYLKIDTEGGDLDVLKGSTEILNEQVVDFIQVEAGMNPDNTRHVPFEALKEFLEAHQYFLFKIYEQVHEWPTKKPHLRRTNPVFISRKMIESSDQFIT